MKTLDYIFRNWRYRIAEPYVTNGCRIMHIGGSDGSFLKRVYGEIASGVCIDPLCEDKTEIIL